MVNGIVFYPPKRSGDVTISRITLFQNNAVNQDFFTKHVNLRKGRRISATAYARRTRWKSGEESGSDASEPMSFDEYKAFVAEYTLDKIAEMTGVPKDQLERFGTALRRSKISVIS